MATIDNLTLEITANTSKAVTDIQKLATALSALRDATKGMSGSNINKVADAMSNFKYSCAGISLSTIRRVTQLADAVERVASINASNISKVADAMRKFNATSGKKNVAGSSATGTGDTFNALSAVSTLGGELQRIFNFPSTNGFAHIFGEDFAKSTARLVDNTSTVNETVQECYGSFRELNDEVTESGEKFEQTAQKTGGFWTKFQTISSLFKKNPVSLLASSENAEGMTKLADASGLAVGFLTKFSKVLGWVGIALSVVSTGLKVVKKAFNAITAPIRSAIKFITSFVKALGRIAFYRFIRSIIKGISSGVKEGVDNLALYSKAMNELDTHSANHVMSRYASEFLYFKNAIATAVMPVLRAMIPLIEQVINKVIDLINVIAQIGSAFFGSTFTKAKYFWVDYADSLDNATGRAKALHHQLAGFDELNNLTAPSGGSGSADLLDPSKMFEEANISEEILGKVNKIKEVIEKIKKLGQDILTILSPINEKGKEIADWFSRLWERVEPNVKKVWELVEKIWNKLAEPLGEGFVKGFVDEFFSTFSDDDKIEKIGKFSDKIGKLADNISKFLDKLDEEKVKKFGENLGKLAGQQLKELPANILAMVFPLFNVVLQFKRFNDTAEKNSDIIQKVVDKLTELHEKAQEVLEPIKQLGIDLVDIAGQLGDEVEFVVDNFLRFGEVDLALEHFSETMKKIFEDIKTTIGGDLDKIKEKILDLFEGIPILGKIAEYFSDQQTGTGGFLRKGLGNNKIKMQGYATGGFVDNGDLFIANERGAEMVGSIGNQTAVANNDQITDAIATATYNAMSKALSENNGSVTFVVEGDGDQMYKIWQKKNKEYGRRTGLAY